LFEPNQFKLKNNLLGVFRETKNETLNGRRALCNSKYTSRGISMILKGLWYFLSGIYFIVLGLTSILVGLIQWTLLQINQSFKLTLIFQEKISKWRKIYLISVVKYNDKKTKPSKVLNEN